MEIPQVPIRLATHNELRCSTCSHNGNGRRLPLSCPSTVPVPASADAVQSNFMNAASSCPAALVKRNTGGRKSEIIQINPLAAEGKVSGLIGSSAKQIALTKPTKVTKCYALIRQ